MNATNHKQVEKEGEEYGPNTEGGREGGGLERFKPATLVLVFVERGSLLFSSLPLSEHPRVSR